MLKGGQTKTCKLAVTTTAAGFTNVNRKSPARCIATIGAIGPGGDTDASNNTTQLVIDVYDKNDLEGETPFLQKPFTAAALSRKVREVLGSP